MIKKLIEKYGNDFNWWVPDSMEYLNSEIQKELVTGHELKGKDLKAIAKCEYNDNALFQGRDRVYIVHLLWNKGDKKFPRYIEFLNLEDAINYIEKEYVDEYKQ